MKHVFGKLTAILFTLILIISCQNALLEPADSETIERTAFTSPAAAPGQNTAAVNQWAEGVLYNGDWTGDSGDVVIYKGHKWRNKFTHTSQVDWYPGAPGLWFWEDLGWADPATVVTCYWTFDIAYEPVTPEGDQTPILIAANDDAIDWDNMTVSALTVASVNSPEDIWFARSVWDRYQMEGCGFFESALDADTENDAVIQLNGTDFTYTGPDVSYTAPDGTTYSLANNETNVTVFALYDIADSAWGKAWDDQNYVESDLIPWKSAAVTRNVNAGNDKELYFPFMDGYVYYDPDAPASENPKVHDGTFIPHDSSWSFSEDEINDPKNKGIDAWIDLYTARYDLYEDLDLNHVTPLINSGSDLIEFRTVSRYDYETDSWYEEELWVAPVQGTGIVK